MTRPVTAARQATSKTYSPSCQLCLPAPFLPSVTSKTFVWRTNLFHSAYTVLFAAPRVSGIQMQKHSQIQSLLEHSMLTVPGIHRADSVLPTCCNSGHHQEATAVNTSAECDKVSILPTLIDNHSVDLVKPDGSHGVDCDCESFRSDHSLLWVPRTGICTAHRPSELRLCQEHHL